MLEIRRILAAKLLLARYGSLMTVSTFQMLCSKRWPGRLIVNVLAGAVLYEPRCEKTGFCEKTRSDTNLAVQPQKIARGLKFRISVVEELYYPYMSRKQRR